MKQITAEDAQNKAQTQYLNKLVEYWAKASQETRNAFMKKTTLSKDILGDETYEVVLVESQKEYRTPTIWDAICALVQYTQPKNDNSVIYAPLKGGERILEFSRKTLAYIREIERTGEKYPKNNVEEPYFIGEFLKIPMLFLGLGSIKAYRWTEGKDGKKRPVLTKNDWDYAYVIGKFLDENEKTRLVKFRLDKYSFLALDLINAVASNSLKEGDYYAIDIQ